MATKLGMVKKVILVGTDGAPYKASSVSTFLGLSDTPAAYTGSALKGVRVNAGADALEFYTISESDTLAAVTGRGATTSTAVEFYANATLGRNGATGALEGSLTLRDGLNPGTTETITYTKWNSLNDANGIVKSNGSGSFSAITDNSTDWNTAYGWGNHASAGYLTAATLSIVSDSPLSGAGTSGSHLAIQVASAAQNGYLSSGDWSTFNGKQAALTFGIADTNAVRIDDAGVADNEFAKFTANGLEGRAYADVKTDLSLNNVENTALSSWAGTNQITTLGTITTGTLGTGSVIGGATVTLGSDADFDMYTRSSNILTRIAPNTAASQKFLAMTGTGAAGQLPTWETVTSSVNYGGTPVVVTTWAELKTAIETTHAPWIRISGTLTADSNIAYPVDPTAVSMNKIKLEGVGANSGISFADTYTITIDGTTSEYTNVEICNLTVSELAASTGAFIVTSLPTNTGSLYLHDIKLSGTNSGGILQCATNMFYNVVIENIYNTGTGGAVLYQACDFGGATHIGSTSVTQVHLGDSVEFGLTSGTRFAYKTSFKDCWFRIDTNATSLNYANCTFINCRLENIAFNANTIGNTFIDTLFNNTPSWDTADNYYTNIFINSGIDTNTPLNKNTNIFKGTTTTTEAVRDLVYQDGTANKYEQADSTDTTKPACGVIVYKPSTTTAWIMNSGIMGGYAALTIGGKVYLSETAGGVTQTKPTTAGALIQEVGVAISATEILFNITPTGGKSFETNSNVTSNVSGTLATDDFVFGSYQLADTTDANHDSRMFFDKSKSAFRAGKTSDDDWDDANVGTYSTAFGWETKASGNNGSFAAGTSCTASGDYSTALNRSNTASGNISFAANYNNTASSDGATAFGTANAASFYYSFVHGDSGNSRYYCGYAQGGGKFNAQADSQYTRVVLRSDTTNATPEEMYIENDGTNGKLIIPASTTWNFDIRVSARQTATAGGGTVGHSAGYKLEGVIKRDGSNNTALVGTPVVTVLGEDNASWNCDVSANDTDETLAITVTGIADATIHWVATVNLTECA